MKRRWYRGVAEPANRDVRAPGVTSRAIGNLARHSGIALLVLVLWGLSAALWFGLGIYRPTPPLEPILPWWAFVALFALTPALLVQFQLREQSRAITLTQLPVVLGLFLLPAAQLVWAWVGGMALFLAYRRLTPVKAALNVTALFFEAVVVTSVFGMLAPESSTSLPHFWPAAFVASLVGDLVSSAVTSTAIALTQRRPRVQEILRPLGFALGANVVVTSLALVAVMALDEERGSLFLVLGIVLLVSWGCRAYARQLQRGADLHRLAEISSGLAPLAARKEDLQPVMEQAAELLVAGQVELTLHGKAPDEASLRLVRHADGSLQINQVDAPGAVAVTSGRAAVLTGNLDRIAVPLKVNGEVAGVLAVRDRLGSVRPFNGDDVRLLEMLASRVGAALEQGSLLEKLTSQADFDKLTRLMSLAELTRRSDELLLRDTPAVVVLLDVVRLQDVNDSLGHAAGDTVLTVVADRLTEVLPATALLARTGGDEFGVLLPLDDPAGPEPRVLVESLVGRVNQLIEVAGVTVDLRVRAGFAVSPADGHSAPALLRRAEIALATTHRNSATVAGYQPHLEARSARRLRLGTDLRRAIDTDDFDIAFQPLIRARDSRVVGAEALVRWRHPDLGAIQPNELVPLAEANGLIGPLTDHVLERSIAQSRAWQQAGMPSRVSVNLSARSVHELSLPSRVLDLLAKHRVLPEMLTLEITETVMMDEPERALGVLERLSSMGVRLSVDDFGTGYSSLAYLRNLPIHEVKLDRAFLSDFDDSHDDMLLRAIVDLAHGMGFEVVAEGVESPAIVPALVALGVDLVQGHSLGAPMPPGAWPAWLAERGNEQAPVR